MTHIIHRHLHVTPPVAVSGDGVFLTDASGNQYIDACGGAAVSCLGHGHPEVLAAMHAQIDTLAYAHTSFFTTEAAEALADQLARTAPAGLGQVVLRQRGLGSHRGGAQAGAAVLRRDRRARAQRVHRAPAELSRQYARRAGGRRQRAAAPALRAPADRRAARGAVLRLSGAAGGGDARGLRRPAGRRARGGHRLVRLEDA